MEIPRIATSAVSGSKLRKRIEAITRRRRFLLSELPSAIHAEVFDAINPAAKRIQDRYSDGETVERISRSMDLDRHTVEVLLRTRTLTNLLDSVERLSDQDIVRAFDEDTTNDGPPSIGTFARAVKESESRVRKVLREAKRLDAEGQGARKTRYPRTVVQRAIALRERPKSTLEKVRRELRREFGNEPSKSTIRRWCGR